MELPSEGMCTICRIKEKEGREENEKVHNISEKKLAERWVMERTNSWHNRFRKLFTRYEKKTGNYLGLVQL